MDEPVAHEAQICVSETTSHFMLQALYFCSRALGISHSVGHGLGARYGIPHGITSVCGPFADGAEILTIALVLDSGTYSCTPSANRYARE
jgi:hypothetical protein